MNVFIIGAAAYIGGSVARILLGAGHAIHGVMRSREKLENLAALQEPLKIPLTTLDLLLQTELGSSPIPHRCMMRFLLTVIFTVFPLASHAELLDVLHSSPSAPNVRADAADAWNEADMDNALKELSPYGNPYAPASPTNLEALVGPYILVQGRRDVILYDPRLPDMFEVSEGGAGRLGLTNERYEVGVATARNAWGMPAATPGWSTQTYGGRH